MIESNKYAIFHINGDPSLDLMGTAVIRGYRDKNDDKKIIVVTNNVDIWLHNPNVYRVYLLGNTPYFYNNYIEGKDSIIFAQDPRKETEYIYKEKHLIEIWCDLCKVPYNNQKPELYFTQREEEVTKKMIPSDQPILFIQSTEIGNQTWTKDLPNHIAFEICNYVLDKGYIPIQIRNQNHPAIPRAFQLNLDLRKTMCALKFSKKRLFIDSFLQHASAALNLSSVITWVTGKPEIQSYNLHDHIMIKTDNDLRKIIDSYSETFDINGQNSLLNIDTRHGFSTREILNKLDL